MEIRSVNTAELLQILEFARYGMLFLRPPSERNSSFEEADDEERTSVALRLKAFDFYVVRRIGKLLADLYEELGERRPFALPDNARV